MLCVVVGEDAKLDCGSYEPRKALKCAVEDWLPEFYKDTSTVSFPFSNAILISCSICICINRCIAGEPDSRTDSEPAQSATSADDDEQLTLRDVMLLCDFFSLPHSHGTKAKQTLRSAHWLASNAARMREYKRGSEKPPEVSEWLEEAYEYQAQARHWIHVCNLLMDIPNRDILYCVYAYVNDMRSVVWLLNSYFKWNGSSLRV